MSATLNNFETILNQKFSLIDSELYFEHDESHLEGRYFWHSKRYFSKLNPRFLTELEKNKKLLERVPYFLVRDGLFSLISFALRNPRFKFTNGPILFHKSLKDFIPSTWEIEPLFFEYYQDQLNNPLFNKEKNLYIVGHCDETFSYQYQEQLKLADKKYNKVLVALSNDYDPFSIAPQRESYIVQEVTREVLSHFPEVKFICYEDILRVGNYSNSSFINLKHPSLVLIDDYFENLMMSKSAKNLVLSKDQKTASDSSFKVPISLNHGIAITTQQWQTIDIVPLLFKKKMARSGHFDLIYIKDYCKSLL